MPIMTTKKTSKALREAEPLGAPPARNLQHMLSDKLTNQIGFQIRLAQIAVYRNFLELLAPLKLRPIHYAALVVIGQTFRTVLARAYSLCRFGRYRR